LKSHQIADRLGVDATFVRKILSKLTKCGYVTSHGGRYGGYLLKVSPKEITVKDVYVALGDDTSIPFYTVPSTGVEFLVSQIIDKAESNFQEELKKFTLQDLVNYKNKQSKMKE